MGIVPNMTLIHTSDSHYDLLVSKKSRIVQNLLGEQQNLEPEADQLCQLKEEHEKLKIKHFECLGEIKTLKETISELKTCKPKNQEKSDDGSGDEPTEEQTLLNGKLNGFSRDSPHSKPLPKSVFTCNICKMKFKTQDQLREHLTQHTNDGDWNCDDCAHQTNSADNLKKHISIAHNKSKHITAPAKEDFPCNLCKTKYNEKSELEEHIRKTHKSFKPCRNLPNCQYASSCIFNHSEINSDIFLCYECGEELKSFGDLMVHRKNNHTMSSCHKFLENKCRFTAESCWFNHVGNFNNSSTVKQNMEINIDEQQATEQ